MRLDNDLANFEVLGVSQVGVDYFGPVAVQGPDCCDFLGLTNRLLSRFQIHIKILANDALHIVFNSDFARVKDLVLRQAVVTADVVSFPNFLVNARINIRQTQN